MLLRSVQMLTSRKYLFSGFPLLRLQFGLVFYYVNYYSKERGLIWSYNSLIQWSMCAESLENNKRKAVFGSSQWDFKRNNFQDFGRRVAADMQRIAVCLLKEIFFHGWKKLKRWCLVLKLFKTSLEKKLIEGAYKFLIYYWKVHAPTCTNEK